MMGGINIEEVGEDTYTYLRLATPKNLYLYFYVTSSGNRLGSKPNTSLRV